MQIQLSRPIALTGDPGPESRRMVKGLGGRLVCVICARITTNGPKRNIALVQSPLILLYVTVLVCSCWAICGSFKTTVVGFRPTALPL
jgi:hypothetical protein